MKIRLCAFADEAGSTIEEQIKALKENNISLIEIRSINGKNISKFTRDEAEKYASELKNNNISVWSLGSPLAKVHILTPIKKEIEKANHLCSLAKIFECENIRAFSFFTLPFFSTEKRVISNINILADILNKNNVNYCHENDTMLYGGTVKGLKKILSGTDKIKLIYDPANYIISKQSPVETLNEFVDKAYYFHIKDAKGKKIVPAGYGDGKLDDLIKIIERDTVFTVEPHLFLFKGGKGFEQYNLTTKRGKFDCAVDSIKKLLIANGFTEKDGYFEK